MPAIDNNGNILVDKDYNMLQDSLGLGGVLKNALI